MPKRTATKGFPCKPEDCYPSRHLDGPDYKVYDLMRAAAPLTNGKRMFYASVQPWLCNAANQARSTIDATLDRLEVAGWIISHGRTRRADGTETPNHYEVLEHDEWVKKHPGSCPDYKFAPNQETAEQFGVSKGEKLGAWLPPRNFWDLSTPLGRGLTKIMSSDDETTAAMIITDEESEALNKVLSKLTPLPVDREGTATHGLPEPLTVHREGTTHGQPESPLPVHRENPSRSTVRNPTKPNLVNQTHTPTPHEPATTVAESDGRVGVCSNTKPTNDKPSIADTVQAAYDRVIDVFIKEESEAPNVTPEQQSQIKTLITRDGEETVTKILRLDLRDRAFYTNKKGERTQLPLRRFLNRYDALKREPDILAKPELTPEVLAKAADISREQRAKLWGTPTPKEPKPEPTPDDF